MVPILIYTQVPEVYEKLIKMGLRDLGTVTGTQKLYVVANDNNVKVPDELKKLCLFTDRAFFVAEEGGD